MRSLVAPHYTDPSGYQLATIPEPVISRPSEVLIKVHAASVNPIDVKLAAGVLKIAITNRYEGSFYPCVEDESSQLSKLPVQNRLRLCRGSHRGRG